MSNILRLPPATAVAPTGLTDYTRQLDIQYALGLTIMGASQIDLPNMKVPEGAVFTLGGVLYKANADESIGGTPSKYVKLTPIASGAQCSASYAANLSGVAWNSVYAGYYDGSGNLYLFDECEALFDGAITVPKTTLGKIAKLSIAALKTSGNTDVGGGLTVAGNESVGGTLSVTGLLTASAGITAGGIITHVGIKKTRFYQASGSVQNVYNALAAKLPKINDTYYEAGGYFNLSSYGGGNIDAVINAIRYVALGDTYQLLTLGGNGYPIQNGIGGSLSNYVDIYF